jgi:hypothetical protein
LPIMTATEICAMIANPGYVTRLRQPPVDLWTTHRAANNPNAQPPKHHLMPTIDRFDDAVGIGGPDEGFGFAVVLACGAPGSRNSVCGSRKRGSRARAWLACCARKSESQACGLRHQGWVGPVVALTLNEPPSEATHWTGRAMAMG